MGSRESAKMVGKCFVPIPSRQAAASSSSGRRRCAAPAQVDVEHYAVERLGMSGKAMRRRAWLERRMWRCIELERAVEADAERHMGLRTAPLPDE